MVLKRAIRSSDLAKTDGGDMAAGLSDGNPALHDDECPTSRISRRIPSRRRSSKAAFA